MAHLLMRKDWMFSAVVPAWHGIGTVTPGVLTAAEAIKTARLDWDTIKEPVFRYHASQKIPAAVQAAIEKVKTQHGIELHPGSLRPLKEWCVTTRGNAHFDDPSGDLGCVKDSYQPINNAACFNVLDRIIGKINARYETAGSLMNGKRVFILAKMDKDFKVYDDVVRPYLLASTAHDGSGALEIKYCLERVVCNNTLTIALSENSTATARVKHTVGALTAEGTVRQHVVDAVRQTLQSMAVKAATNKEDTRQGQGIIDSLTAFMDRQQTIFTHLADSKVTSAFVDAYLHVLVPEPFDSPGTRSTNKRQTIADIYYGTQPGDELRAMKIDRHTGTGTAWRLYNAVTHYNDHVAVTKITKNHATGEKRTFAEARFDRIFNPESFREIAMNVLTEAVDTKGDSLKTALKKWESEKKEHQRRQLLSN